MITSQLIYNRSKAHFGMLIFGFLLLSHSCNPAANTSVSNGAPSSTETISIEKPDALDEKIEELMAAHKVPGVSIALLKNGKLNSIRNYGVLQSGKEQIVNQETMFSVGSISKVVNAIILLKMVQEGKLSLDENVNQYLTHWKIEENVFTKDKAVTLRKILSHTAGLSVSGFPDYLPEEELPTTMQILNGEKPAKNGRVEVILPVGSKFQYSGGGTTITQKIIEDVTGISYAEAANKYLFTPLNLKRTSFENPLPRSFANVAKAHDGLGEPIALPRGYQSMPEAAASGLWTTPTELAEILSLLKPGITSKAYLNNAVIQDMISREPNSEWGLGPKIILTESDKLVEHGGSNDSYKAFFCLFWKGEYGYVIMTNGSGGMKLIDGTIATFDDVAASQ